MGDDYGTLEHLIIFVVRCSSVLLFFSLVFLHSTLYFVGPPTIRISSMGPLASIYRVHVFNPHGVDGPVEDDPFPVV